MSTGLHARRTTGLTVAEWEESFTRTESVARWPRERLAAYEAVREALMFVFFFLTGARCSNETINNNVRSDGDCFILFMFSFSFGLHLYCGALPFCAFYLVHIKKSMRYNGSTYMHAASGLFSWMEQGTLALCKSPVCA